MSAPCPTGRTRADLCPGALRPWPAADGALVRLRVPGGQLPPASLGALGRLAARHGDGQVHLTSRANLQLRGLPATNGRLDDDLIAELEATGLLPSRSHELVRNVVVSPLTGLTGGRADLRPVMSSLDTRLCSDPFLFGLSARFLFTLDDGRGDVARRQADLGLIALDDATAQLRIGDTWGDVVALDDAVELLLSLAREFVTARGHGASAPWHVRELASPLRPAGSPDPRATVAGDPPPYGLVPGTSAEHVEVPGGVADPELLERLTAQSVEHLVVTPWRGVIVVRA